MRTRGRIAAVVVAAALASVSLTGCVHTSCSLVPMQVELNPETIAPGGSSTVTVTDAWAGCDVFGRVQARSVPVIIEVLQPASFDVLATVTIPISPDGSGRGVLDLAADMPEGVYALNVDHHFDRNLWVTAHP
jgi:hypothetical protein